MRAFLLLALLVTSGVAAVRVQAQAACEGGAAAAQTCFATWAAEGRYQEIIDRIETREIGYAAHEKYFLGIAYYALAGRAGAASLRCFRVTQAKAHLESFLEDRQKTAAELSSLGNALELQYTYIAARVLESAREMSGCDEPGESLTALGRHARTHLSTTVEDLFFNYGAAGATETPLHRTFAMHMGHLQQTIRNFVSVVSRMETNYQLTEIEIGAANRDLGTVVERMNAWKRGAIKAQTDAVTATWNITFEPPLDELFADIAAKERYYKALAFQGGELGEAKTAIDRFILASGASGMKDYQDRRSGTVAAANRLAADLARVHNDVTRVLGGAGATQLTAAVPANPGSIEARFSDIERAWKERRPACNVTPDKWYCK